MYWTDPLWSKCLRATSSSLLSTLQPWRQWEKVSGSLSSITMWVGTRWIEAKQFLTRLFSFHSESVNFIHFQVTFENLIIFIKGFLKTIQTNVGGTMNLVSVMEQFNVKSLIFSSSATVYGTPQYLPLDEVCTPQYLPLNPLRGSTPGPWTPQGLYRWTPGALRLDLIRGWTPLGLCPWTP